MRDTCVRGMWRFCGIAIVLLTTPELFGQQVGIDTAAIRSLVHEWNFANNTQSTETFRNVYGDRLLFYTQELSQSEAIGLKQKMFAEKPGFKQTLGSVIHFSLFTSGVIKCDFQKEVWERSR